jgi:hypothetical protein
MVFYRDVIIILIGAFILFDCKPRGEGECPTVEQQEIIVNQTQGAKSQMVYCDGNRGSKILRVQRVFMHEWNLFSFMVEAEEGKRSVLMYLNSRVYPEFIWDVPRGEAAYAVCRYDENNGDLVLKMHLHAKDQVVGAGWDHGEIGGGQTSVVPMERP